MRERGLTANQLLYLPGAGDFQIEQIDGAPPPQPALGAAAAGKQPRPAAACGHAHNCHTWICLLQHHVQDLDVRALPDAGGNTMHTFDTWPLDRVA